MYKMCYYPLEGSTKVDLKEFESLDDAFEFLFKRPNGTLIELKYCPDTNTSKPDRT